MIMDVIRTPYRRKARIFKDSDKEVTLSWYFAPQGAKFFPFPHLWGSADWLDKEDEWPRLGEVKDPPRRWAKGGSTLPYLGQCFCGDPEWYRTGVPYSPAPTPPPMPECCSQLPQIGAGMGGGSAVVTSGRNLKIGGGSGGGSADVRFGRVTGGAGGGSGAGAALVVAGRGGMGLLWGGLGPGGLLLGGWQPGLAGGGLGGGEGEATDLPGPEGEGGGLGGGKARCEMVPENSRLGGGEGGGSARVTRYDPNAVYTPTCPERINYALDGAFSQCTGGLAGLPASTIFVHTTGFLWLSGIMPIGNNSMRFQLDLSGYSPAMVPLSCNCIYISGLVPVTFRCSPLYLEYFATVPASGLLCGLPRVNATFRLKITPRTPS